MYRPRVFNQPDVPTLHRYMQEASFAILVTDGARGMEATHLPVVVKDGGEQGLVLLRAHMALANEQWRDFGDREVLVIFQGVHGYISPSWYAEQPSVPTWDYVAVHAYGVPRLVREETEVRAMLHELVSQYEHDRPRPWSSEDLPSDYLERMMKGIVAFEIQIARLEGKVKMGQNRKAEQPAVALALEGEGQAALATAIRVANSVPGNG